MVYYVDFFVFLVLRHWCVLQMSEPYNVYMHYNQQKHPRNKKTLHFVSGYQRKIIQLKSKNFLP